jgi:RHS repeat-associated protein
MYFDAMWAVMSHGEDERRSKNIYVGQTRIATRLNRDTAGDSGYERRNTYWYHPDHLGSAQLITDPDGEEYERIEYTPYGELWVEATANGTDLIPYRFTGKELDSETGLYYYGARYLDPKTSVWLSADPALGEYVPVAPVDDEAKKHNGNLPGMGGLYNTVNMQLYHYAVNNPIKYTDPDGRRDISAAEASFINEVLGDIGSYATRNTKIVEIPDGRAASTRLAYSGQIWLGSSIFSNPLSRSYSRNTFMHEVFHQVQHMFEPSGLIPGIVFGSSAMDKLITEQMLYGDGEPVYDFGDFTKTDLATYSKLSDMPYYESQAQMVGDFAELYSTAKGGGTLSPTQTKAIKDMARILSNSGFNTEAVKWVGENIE